MAPTVEPSVPPTSAPSEKPTAVPTMTPTHGFCTAACIEANVDYQGNDLIKGGVTSHSPADCCAKCQATAGCKYWTQSKDSTQCWVKSAALGYQSQSNRESGTLLVSNSTGACAKSSDFPVGACQSDCIEESTDYQGNDLVKGGLPATSASECCSKCKATSKCIYWTFGTKDGASVCWVKWASAGVQSQVGRTSGTLLVKNDGTCAKKADWLAQSPNACNTTCFQRNTDYQGSDLVKVLLYYVVCVAMNTTLTMTRACTRYVSFATRWSYLALSCIACVLQKI